MIDDFFNELLSGFANPKRAFSMYKKDKFNEFRRRVSLGKIRNGGDLVLTYNNGADT